MALELFLAATGPFVFLDNPFHDSPWTGFLDTPAHPTSRNAKNMPIKLENDPNTILVHPRYFLEL